MFSLLNRLPLRYLFSGTDGRTGQSALDISLQDYVVDNRGKNIAKENRQHYALGKGWVNHAN
jgi:hypothetical protein